MNIKEVMTRDVQVVKPGDTVRRAAKLMDDLNIGSIPVCDGARLVGMVTDRDITVRPTSQGKSPDECKVADVMTQEVRYCFDDEPVDKVSKQMADSQIRRVPVVNRDKQLVGIVALGDLATRSGQQGKAEGALNQVSQPSKPDR